MTSALSRRATLVAAALCFASVASCADPARARPVVAAAADLNAAMPHLVRAFTDATGLSVTPVLGSSGNFTQQIRNGAPFEVFLSADETYVETLHAEGGTEDAGGLYAMGFIGVFVPRGSALVPDGELRDLAAAMDDGRLSKFAMANPEHAPYGRAAQEALAHAGLWERIQPFLVFGENAAHATQFATSGSAEGGIIPLSLARTDHVARTGSFALIPDTWYTPLRQRAVLLRGAGETARQFYAFLFTPPAREILSRHGFVLPGEGT